MPRYHVHRSIEINAAPENVFSTVADYDSWTTWSPWLCAEPDAEVRVSEDSASVGSVYSWKGEIVGEGELEHLNLEPGRLVDDEIRFVKPFRSKSRVSFELQPSGDGTRITWHMRGSLPWFLFWMRSQMETFIGMDYERGLSMLKEWIETGTILSKTKIHGVKPVGPLAMVGIRKSSSMRDLGSSMKSSLDEAKTRMSNQGLSTDGEAISVYHKFDMQAQIFDYTTGLMIPDASLAASADLSSWSLPATQALCVEHIGSYDHLGNAWSAAHQVVRYKRFKQSKAGTYEIYKNNPDSCSPGDLRTEIFLPLKG